VIDFEKLVMIVLEIWRMVLDIRCTLIAFMNEELNIFARRKIQLMMPGRSLRLGSARFN
jgi:hypothetical protein